MKKLTALILALLMVVALPLTLASCGDSAYNLPIVCGEGGMTSACGVATYGVDYYQLGVLAGDMAADILLNGTSPADIAVQQITEPPLSVYENIAEEIGFTIPEAVKNRAQSGTTDKVVGGEGAIVTEGNADFTVGVLQLMQHVALDQANEGFVHQLSKRLAENPAENGGAKTVKFDQKNASGDVSNNAIIAQGFVDADVDLIYAIATPSAKAAQSATAIEKIPVLFNAVTNPVGEGLVASMAAPGDNVTGVSDMNPVADQIALIGELLEKDDVKVGFLYTTAETNSQYQVNIGKAACEELGYTYVEKGISDINDLRSAMIALANEGVDAIYIPTDNVLANGIATVHSINTMG